MKTFHNCSKEELFEVFKTTEKGLTSIEAQNRLQKYGKNELKTEKQKTWLQRFFSQLKDLMIVVLLVSAVISALISIIQGHYAELVDSAIILLIVIMNGIIGTIQESKADKAMQELSKMNKPFAKVLRDGKTEKIKCENIVVGDIVIIDSGDVIPADLRLISSVSLKIQEATLTGESVPSDKDHSLKLNDNVPLGDRKTMAYSSGVVSYGRGSGIVVATGMNTEVGKIAGMLNIQPKNTTPLQKQLAKTAKILSFIVLFIALIIFIVSVINKPFNQSLINSITKSFITAVAIAVAAIPEGLPAVVTIVLAMGVKKMSEKNAIVKNLPAVETLGCCEVICSDKTGTLTLNEMTVKQLYTISNNTYLNNAINKTENEMLVNAMVLCNNTEINKNNFLGDPTEIALTKYAIENNFKINTINKSFIRVNELPFDSNRKLMSTLHKTNSGETVSFTKGAFDMLINNCSYVLKDEREVELTQNILSQIKSVNLALTNNALRVLGVAYKRNAEIQTCENNLVFVGLVGMIDPPREEVVNAVKTCKEAGMTAVMITGDHLNTAVAIATQIGIYNKETDTAITGEMLDKLSQEEFLKNLFKIKVYARVSPENKVRIVNAYKQLNIVVAMTGDGVNDAPSIKSADVGIGMGVNGTDVSKGVADIVLADDNFATIITAVEEGRKVYSNIKKSLQYLLSANIAEVLCLFIATIFFKVEFLSAVMILWINLVTDSLPALALGAEKTEKNIMKQPPRKANKSLFANETGVNIVVQGLMQTVLTLLSFFIGGHMFSLNFNNSVATTMAFLTLSLIQLFHAYNVRQLTESIFVSNPLRNKFLNYSFLAGILLILFTFIPTIQSFFGTTLLTINQALISICCAFAIIPLVEIQKLFQKLIKNKKTKKQA